MEVTMKKSNDLSVMLRKIISEEVSKAVRKEFVQFVQLLNEKKKPVRRKKKPITEKSIRDMAKRIVPKEAKSYTKDPVLNEILNNTQGGVPQDGQMAAPQPTGQEEWPTMGGGTFDKNSMASLMGYGDNNPVQQMAPMTTPDGRPITEIPQDVTQAMTRNYGDLMQAIDKKKQGGPLKG